MQRPEFYFAFDGGTAITEYGIGFSRNYELANEEADVDLNEI